MSLKYEPASVTTTQRFSGSAEGRSRGLEASRSILEPVTISFSMKCDATALSSRKDALEAALRKVAAEFEGLDFRPSTLNPLPSTLNPQPYTLHPTPCTLNPKP